MKNVSVCSDVPVQEDVEIHYCVMLHVPDGQQVFLQHWNAFFLNLFVSSMLSKKIKLSSVAGRGGLQGCHIAQTLGSQFAVRLSVLRASRRFTPQKHSFLILISVRISGNLRA
jgi:hypothetical protein